MILTTERLQLREMIGEDLPFLASMLADPETMRFYPSVLDAAEARAWLERQLGRYASYGHGWWLVERRTPPHEPIGQVGLTMQEVDGSLVPEIGYMIQRSNWRQGFAAEAAIGVRDHAFDVRGYDRVISLIRPENLPSQRVAARMGMTPETMTMFRGYPHRIHAIRRTERPVV